MFEIFVLFKDYLFCGDTNFYLSNENFLSSVNYLLKFEYDTYSGFGR